ncbi:MAG: hypothetical protein B7Y55_01100 [Polynucleobacter sp. 35-46-207]|jgi:hypothetical protein|nr:MAG: hypothetical protein B7Y55_01100 [Polynucleobacter sp. 35-46-207]OZB49408.1 MAG: hypothetical protein B7X60_01210 [Polynucleobacter sp. 39-45-136]
MANPNIPQGTLNRIRSNITIPGNTALNVTPAYMDKSFVTVTFDGEFDNLIPTATGGVTSPEPYVMATVSFGLLRTQALANAWQSQVKALSDLGNVSIFPDTTAYAEIDLVNCVVSHIDPGPFDGTNPSVKVTLRGIYYVNNDLWNI